ncbi:MAG: DUF6266 family protein [Prolixibacteraceae bacterium]|nr:DUF6266 family protein [Prolixibacteraceae bacterium]
MGKISQGILGGVSGTVGNVVGGSWKGINYLRVKAQHFQDAKTEGQVGQRAKFGACVALAKSLLDNIIKPIWDKRAKKMSGYNLFVKSNINQFDESGEIEDFSNLKISIGDLQNARNMDVSNDDQTEGGIILSWEDNSGINNASQSDRLNILAYCNGEIAILDSIEAVRADGMAQVTLPFGAGVDVHVYAFFENEAKTSYSKDQYAFVEVS